ncbi:MAG: DivIVA domain-containing protein [bacterium]
MTTGIDGNQRNNGRAGAPLDASTRTVSFGHATGFGTKGYNEEEVDTYVSLTNRQVEEVTRQNAELADRIRQLEADNADLNGRVRSEEDIINQSVSILSTAQQTADATVSQADEYSGKVMSEARTLYDDSARQARDMVAEARRVAEEVTEQTSATRDEVERQTVYLRTLLDSSKVQLTSFLDGLLHHVAAEFGKSSVRASEIAAQFPSWEDRR